MQIKNSNILVLGGAGLIGSHTIELLLKKNPKKIIIYDNFERGKIQNLNKVINNPKVQIFPDGGDILQIDILNKAMRGIDYVFHFAALWLLQCHEYPRSAFNTNIMGTFNVIDLCVKNKIKKLVYSSSASVYGDAEINPIKENHSFNNKNFYGATKICGEAMLRSFFYRYGLNFIGLRYMNVYGPRQDSKGAYVAVLIKMIINSLQNKEIEIYGNGREKYDFVSVYDCAKANINALESKCSNKFLNVGTGVGTTLIELAEKIIKITGSKSKIIFRKQANKTIVKNRVGYTKNAEKNINFKYDIDLNKGLKDLINFEKNNFNVF
jgi:UDP-glucose 4-epimerase